MSFEIYIPIITSILAIAISSLTFGWTIYRDAIRKPKFRVTIATKEIHHLGLPKEGPFLFVEALNLGPIPNKIGATLLRKNWIASRLDREHARAFVVPDFGHWATTKPATRLEVGDRADFLFPYNDDCFLKENFMQVGVTDGFGRIHWCKRADMRKAQEKHRRDFAV